MWKRCVVLPALILGVGDDMKQLWRPGEFRSCTNLRLVANVGLVACGQCDNCHKERQLMWIGRNLMEMQTGEYGLFATLTYGVSDRLYDYSYWPVGADIFVKTDVAEYLKRFRKHMLTDWRQAKRTDDGRAEYCRQHQLPVFPERPRMRTFVVGERGDMKQRCHWHLLLYLTGSRGPSDLPLGRFGLHGKYPEEILAHVKYQVIDGDHLRRDFRPGSGVDWYQSDRTFWPHGLVKYEERVPQHPFYVCNYLVADQTMGSDVARPSQSRRPILGADYLEQLALQHVDQMISPQERAFTLPRNAGYRAGGVMGEGSDGRLVTRRRAPLTSYWMGRSAARIFGLAFARLWSEAHAADPERYAAAYPRSDFIDDIVEAEQDAVFEKQHKDEPMVKDDLRDEFIDAIVRDARSNANGGWVRGSNEERRESAQAYADALSPGALRWLFGASLSDNRRLKRTALKRYWRMSADAPGSQSGVDKKSD